MTTIPTNVNGTATNVDSNGMIKTGNSATDKNQFLLLLINELRNQDPTAPTDQKETLSQLAQFSQLEATQNLSDTLSASAGFSNVAQSAALIGKTVSTATEDAAGVSGVVSAVSFSGGKTYLHVGTQDIDASTITHISQ